MVKGSCWIESEGGPPAFEETLWSCSWGCVPTRRGPRAGSHASCVPQVLSSAVRAGAAGVERVGATKQKPNSGYLSLWVEDAPKNPSEAGVLIFPREEGHLPGSVGKDPRTLGAGRQGTPASKKAEVSSILAAENRAREPGLEEGAAESMSASICLCMGGMLFRLGEECRTKTTGAKPVGAGWLPEDASWSASRSPF